MQDLLVPASPGIEPFHFAVEVRPGDDVRDAVNRCPTGCSVLFHPGSYSIPRRSKRSGQLRLGRSIRLFGRGRATLNFVIFVLNDVGHVTIDGFTIRPEGTRDDDTISSGAAVLSVTGCVIEGEESGIVVRDGRATIARNRIRAKDSGIHLNQDTSGDVTHNTITFIGKPVNTFRPFATSGIFALTTDSSRAHIVHNHIAGFNTGINAQYDDVDDIRSSNTFADVAYPAMTRSEHTLLLDQYCFARAAAALAKDAARLLSLG